jgi:hypothetical protein
MCNCLIKKNTIFTIRANFENPCENPAEKEVETTAADQDVEESTTSTVAQLETSSNTTAAKVPIADEVER